MPKNNMGIDEEGNILPYSSDEVDKIAEKILEEGTILAVISELHGEISIRIMGEPHETILEALETTIKAYRKILSEISKRRINYE